ncbi:MAG: response regulator [Parvularculaceae bacterium]
MTKERQARLEALARDPEALAALVDEHEMLVRAVHGMPQMFYIVKDDRLVFCNRHLAEFYKLPEGVTVAGTPWTDLMKAILALHVSDKAARVEDMKADVVRRIKENGRFRRSWALDDGRHLVIEALDCGDGMTIVIYSDVTALKVAQQKAEASERAKSAFLANMSHEIRTPMNGVMGMAELLCTTPLNDTQTTYATTILKSGEALLTIINDILDFSKIDAGQMKLHPAPFAIAEAIEDVAVLISSRVKDKDLELAVRIQPDLPPMFVGDAGRLRQIVTNLLGNASKFTDHGHILVDLSGKPADDGYKLTFKVEDTGIGIPAEKCAAIFEKFSQVDDSATRKHEGTGLGLAIAASLVQIMGGEIGVDSVPGEGSTFWFTITLPVHEGEARRHAPVDISGARIAVIDDNAVNRAILKEQLGVWGFDCALYKTGQEGLMALREQAASGHAPDLVILDHHMPGMTGADVAMLLRADPLFKTMPIIMLTSVDEAAGGAGFLSLGVNAHLTKPARSTLLFNTMVKALQQKAGAEEEDAAPAAAKAAAPARKAESTGGIDVLVAEDNEVNRLVLTHLLNDAGVTYKIAHNGREAVAMHAEFSPAVILMDVSMPEMNGFEATKAIRAAEAETGKRTPIIAITAHAMKDDKDKCLAGGMDDYISKPISGARLKDRLAHWIAKRDEAAA